MSFIQSILLGIIQGISEFLPISSSGHLNLAQYILNIKPSLTLDIFLNTATFVSVLFFFRKQIPYFIKNLLYIIISTIPAALVGFLFKDNIESIFANIKWLPFFFLITTIFVFSTKFIANKSEKLDWKKALIIGMFQAIAILPGVSRAGSTIFIALLLGLSPKDAFNYSFCLFIPASLGAIVLSYKDLQGLDLSDPKYIASFIITVIIGILALSFLRRLVTSNKLWIFGIYTAIISIITFFIFF